MSEWPAAVEEVEVVEKVEEEEVGLKKAGKGAKMELKVKARVAM